MTHSPQQARFHCEKYKKKPTPAYKHTYSSGICIYIKTIHCSNWKASDAQPNWPQLMDTNKHNESIENRLFFLFCTTVIFMKKRSIVFDAEDMHWRIDLWPRRRHSSYDPFFSIVWFLHFSHFSFMLYFALPHFSLPLYVVATCWYFAIFFFCSPWCSWL